MHFTQNISIKISPLENEIIPVEKNLSNNINFSISCENRFDAPLNKNTQIGIIEIYAGSKKMGDTEILIDCDISKKGIIDYLFQFLSYKWWAN